MRAFLRTLVWSSILVSPIAAQIELRELAGRRGLVFESLVGGPAANLPNDPDLHMSLGSGCAVADYDGDGDLDVYLLGGNLHPNALFRNELVETGEARFTDVTSISGQGLADTGSSRLAHFADLDNDDDLDLVLINDLDPELQQPPSLIFANNGNGTFTNVTAGSGFHPVGFALCGAGIVDYDQDGLLDILVTAWCHHGGFPQPFTQWAGQLYLYRNLGDFRFADVTTAAGFAPPGGVRYDWFTPIFTDITGNGYPDVHIAVDHATDAFYENNGGVFTLRSAEYGIYHVGNDMGNACADIDNDGDFDFFTTNITDQGCGFGTPPILVPNAPPANNALMMQQRDPLTGEITFRNESVLRGVEDTYWGWGTEFIDLDDDGDLDLVAATGFDDFIRRVSPGCGLLATPSVLFENVGDAQFERRYDTPLETNRDDSRALVSFDFDRDGRQDVLITNVNQPVRLFRNQTRNARGGINASVDIEVRQVHGNRQGIGAVIDVMTADGTRLRQPILAGESFLAGTPAEAHFGLGDNPWVRYIRVHWTDGTATTLRNVYADGLMRIEQPRVLCNWDRNLRVDETDAWLFAWAWVLQFPDADLNGNEIFDMEDIRIFLRDWTTHRGPLAD